MPREIFSPINPEFNGNLNKSKQEYAEYFAKKSAEYPHMDMSKFTNLKSLEDDLALVQSLKTRMAAEDTPEEKEIYEYSNLFEILLAERIDASGWLGQEASVVRTSEYDDLVGGIDMVAEFENPEGFFSNLGLAVDVTFSKNRIAHKIEKIKAGIDENKLGHVKYFYSEKQEERKELLKIPQVVVGTDKSTIDELMALVTRMERLNSFRKSQVEKLKKENPDITRQELEQQTAGTSHQLTGIWSELENHPYQIELLEQILLQLKTYKAYATKIKNGDIVNRYNVTIKLIEYILDGKDDLFESQAYQQRNKAMLNQIQKSLAAIFPA